MKTSKSYVVTESSRQWPQFLAVISASLLAICSGFQLGWPSPSILKLLSSDLDFDITEEEVSYLVMIAPLGYLIGSPLSGFLLDKLGRKNTLILLSIPQIVPWILIATSTGIPVLYIARFISGIADGAVFTSLPVYVCELLEPQIRGVGGATHSLGIVMGVLLINCYGSYMSIRTTAYVSLAAPLLFLVTFVWMPESPYYLLIKNRTEDARRALKRLRRMKNVENELSTIALDVKRQISEPGHFKDIFTIKSNLNAFLVMFGLRTLQQFSGISALAFYVQVIFKQAGGKLSPAESSIICFGIQVVAIAFSSLVIDRFGRRCMIIFSSMGCAVTLATLGLYFLLQAEGYNVSYCWWLPIAGIVLYNVIVSTGVLPIPNIMAGELLSVSIKSKALGLTNMYFGLCMSASSKLFQWLDRDFGMQMPFFVFGLCCVLGAVFCYYFVPETKGMRLEEIQQILKGRKTAREDSNETRV